MPRLNYSSENNMIAATADIETKHVFWVFIVLMICGCVIVADHLYEKSVVSVKELGSLSPCVHSALENYVKDPETNEPINHYNIRIAEDKCEALAQAQADEAAAMRALQSQRAALLERP